MIGKCIAYRDDGRPCGAPAWIIDTQRGGVVCPQHGIPPELLQDPGWSAALVILRSRMFAGHTGVWSFVDLRQGWRDIDFDGILGKTGWSHGELLMLQAAYSLFSGGCTVRLDDLVAVLDDAAFTVLLDAIVESRHLGGNQ